MNYYFATTGGLTGGMLFCPSHHQLWIKVKILLTLFTNEEETTCYFQTAAFPMLSHSRDSKVLRPSSPPLNPKTN